MRYISTLAIPTFPDDPKKSCSAAEKVEKAAPFHFSFALRLKAAKVSMLPEIQLYFGSNSATSSYDREDAVWTAFMWADK